MTWMVIIILAGATMLVMSIVMACVLGWANVKFRVDVDPRITAVVDALPGANCGGCGYVGCGEYAEAVVLNGEAPDKCAPGGDDCSAAIAQIMGVEIAQSLPYRPVVHCGAHTADKLGRHEYTGQKTCASANLVAGVQGCTFGCLGMGDCVAVCEYGAIRIIDGLATVDYQKCVGCKACAKACPRNIITMVPFKAKIMYAITCSNKDFGKDVRNVCKVGCLGCKSCARTAGELFSVSDNLSRIDYEHYDPEKLDGASVMLEKCPSKRIVPVGNPTAEDKIAVADEKLPKHPVQAEFKTTVDEAEWKG